METALTLVLYSYLKDKKSQFNFALVSRKFNSLVVPVLYSNMKLLNQKHLRSLLLSKHLTHVRTLDVTAITSKGKPEPLSNTYLCKLLYKMNLISLVLDESTWVTDELFKYTKTLRKLSINKCIYIRDFTSAFTPYLEELNAANCKSVESFTGIQKCTSLKSLNLDHCEIKSLEGLDKCTSLEVVSLIEISCTDFKPIKSMLSNLKKLILDENIIGSSLLDNVSHKLHFLSLEDCGSLLISGSTVDNASSLRYLFLSRCLIQNNQLPELLMKCSNLKTLHLSEMDTVNDDIVCTISRYCTNLIELCISGCERLTPEIQFELLSLANLKILYCTDTKISLECALALILQHDFETLVMTNHEEGIPTNAPELEQLSNDCRSKFRSNNYYYKKIVDFLSFSEIEYARDLIAIYMEEDRLEAERVAERAERIRLGNLEEGEA